MLQLEYPDLLFAFQGPSWSWSHGSWIYNNLCNQSVSITTKVVISNPAHGEVYSIQHYVLKFVRDLRQVSGFLLVLQLIDCTGCCKSNYHAITTTMAPEKQIINRDILIFWKPIVSCHSYCSNSKNVRLIGT
jgi:hypothetical protein